MSDQVAVRVDLNDDQEIVNEALGDSSNFTSYVGGAVCCIAVPVFVGLPVSICMFWSTVTTAPTAVVTPLSLVSVSGYSLCGAVSGGVLCGPVLDRVISNAKSLLAQLTGNQDTNNNLLSNIQEINEIEISRDDAAFSQFVYNISTNIPTRVNSIDSINIIRSSGVDNTIAVPRGDNPDVVSGFMG